MCALSLLSSKSLYDLFCNTEKNCCHVKGPKKYCRNALFFIFPISQKKKGNSKVGLRRHELKFPRFVGFQTCLFITTCNSMILSKTCFDIMFSRLKMEGLVLRYQESNHSLKVFCTCFKSTSTSINHHLKLWH